MRDRAARVGGHVLVLPKVAADGDEVGLAFGRERQAAPERGPDLAPPLDRVRAGVADERPVEMDISDV